MYSGLNESTPYSCPMLMKLEFSRQNFGKCSNIKFHQNPSSGSRSVPCGQKDRHNEDNSHFSQLCESTWKCILKKWNGRVNLTQDRDQWWASLNRVRKLAVNKNLKIYWLPMELIDPHEVLCSMYSHAPHNDVSVNDGPPTTVVP